MKRVCMFLSVLLLLLTACTSDNVANNVSSDDGWIHHEMNWSKYYAAKEEQMANKYETKCSSPRANRFLFSFPRTYAWFDLVPVYRFNYYGNSRVAVLWEHTEAIFNCSIIDDEELIRRLKEEGYKEVKTFNKEVKFAWREFEDDFVEPICFEQKFIAEDITYGSKTYYNKVVICKPFNNSDARANEMVVFFDVCCDNREAYYEKVIKTIDGRPVTEILNSVKEWGLIEANRLSTE